MKIGKQLPYLFLLILYVFAYTPYFLFYPLPDIQQDSYIYFWAASLIRDGIIPFPKFTIDVPVGHPVFVWVVKSLFTKTGAVIVVQNILFVLASLYFIYCFGKLRCGMKWVAAIAVGLFAIDNFTMRMNTSLYTESIYTTSLIFIGANLALVTARFTPTNISILIFSLLIPGLIRPNGIYVFFIVPLFFIVIFKYRGDTSYYKALIFSFFCVLLIWSSINFVFKGFFLPSDPYRISWVKSTIDKQFANNKYYVRLSQTQPAITQGTEKSKNAGSKFIFVRQNLFVRNLTAFAQSKPSFYFSFLPTRNEQIYEKDMVGDPNQLLFNRFKVDSVSPMLKAYLFAEYRENDSLSELIARDCKLKQDIKNHYWLYFNHLTYKLYDLLIWNLVWVFAFVTLGFYAFYKFFSERDRVQENFLLLSLFLMHAVSLFTITLGHGGFQLRYAHVTSIFLLTFVLSQMFSLFGGLKKQ